MDRFPGKGFRQSEGLPVSRKQGLYVGLSVGPNERI
jgi:hypothetical protein